MGMNRVIGSRRGLLAAVGAALSLGGMTRAEATLIFAYACYRLPDDRIIYAAGWVSETCAELRARNPWMIDCDELFHAFTLPPSGGVGNGYSPAFDRAVTLGVLIPPMPGASDVRIAQGYYPAADPFLGGSYSTTVFAIRESLTPGAPNQFAAIEVNQTGLSPAADGIVLTPILVGEPVTGPFNPFPGPLVGSADITVVVQTYASANPSVALDERLIPVDLGSLVWQDALPLPPACLGDCDRSGAVAFGDVTSVLANFGATYSVGVLTPGDAQGDRVVNFADITTVLANFGTACE